MRLGRWDEAVATAEGIVESNATDEDATFVLPLLAGLLAARGDDQGVRRCRDLVTSGPTRAARTRRHAWR